MDATDTSTRTGWARKKVAGGACGAWDLLRTPAYAVPLACNLLGSVGFFAVVGRAGECGSGVFGLGLGGGAVVRGGWVGDAESGGGVVGKCLGGGKSGGRTRGRGGSCLGEKKKYANGFVDG